MIFANRCAPAAAAAAVAAAAAAAAVACGEGGQDPQVVHSAAHYRQALGGHKTKYSLTCVFSSASHTAVINE